MVLYKTSDPPPPPHGAIFDSMPTIWKKKIGSGQLDEPTYQIVQLLKTWTFWFKTRRFLSFQFKKSILAPVT